jgi:lactose/L-arabinose transport system ATP-binding protein
MNFIKARHNGGRLAPTDFVGKMLPAPSLATPLAEGQEVTVGLRPQAIGHEGAGQLDLVIDVIEHLGSETLVHTRPHGSGHIITAVVDDGRALRPGETFTARFAPEKLMIFGAGGERLR